MVRVSGSRYKTKPLVEASRVVVFGVYGDRADASDVCGLERPQHAVLEQPRTEPLPLPIQGDGQPGEQHYRNRMPGQSLSEALRCAVVLDLGDDKRVEPYDIVADQRHVSL